jgi:putative pyoverdin transport system ATP-binding/permease protein
MKGLIKILMPAMGRWGLVKYTVLGLLSGACSFLFVNAVTKLIGYIMDGSLSGFNYRYTFILGGIIVLFILVRRILALGIINLSQSLFWRLRKEVLLNVLNAGYEQLMAKRTQVRTAVLNDVHVSIEASLNIIQFFTSAILAISCLGYLLSISLILFGITVVIAVIGILIYYFKSAANTRQFQRARELEDSFQENFDAMVNGFKEIYMEPEKGKYIYTHRINVIADESFSNNKRAFTGFLNNQIIGQVLFYVLISSVLLFFSWLFNMKVGDTVSYVFTLLYLLSAIETVLALMPGIARAKIASAHLLSLKSELEEADFYNPIPANRVTKEEFSTITAEQLEFSYGDEDRAFAIGPADFTVNKNDIIFIYGGNGSGKTTFIHTLLGLRDASGGVIKLNGNEVNDGNYADYRSAFSVVFSDFYLFDQLLTEDVPDLDKWNHYLHLFELDGIVTLEGNRYTTTNISTGQRKRLALVTVLMEDKPVLVLDEWAADQDPYFRKKFYTEILPLLKQQGFTIIAITHDDKYYKCADKLYRMDYGKLVQENVPAADNQLSLI